MIRLSDRLLAGLLALVGAAVGAGAESAAPEQGCRVVRDGGVVELHSPFFVYCLDPADGLRAQWWENRLTGRRLSLGQGAELGVDVGPPGGPLETPRWRVVECRDLCRSDRGEAVFELVAEGPRLTARASYRWNAREPVLHKLVEVTNPGDRPLNRLLNVRLGTYRTETKVTCREQGFPLYLGDEFFMGLAHPAGWAMGQEGQAELRHFPGAVVAPGATFRCMEAVYGVGRAGEARQAFLTHLQSRMRRVVRGHDRAYAIFEPFGARPDGDFNESEAFVLDNIAKVAQGQREQGCHFDLYSVDFWVDYHGDLKAFDPARFPGGLQRINAELKKLGTAPGLWIDSAGPGWSIGGNPKVQAALNFDPAQGPGAAPWGRPSFCRATEPIRSMYTAAFRHHIRDNGVRVLKFDNFADQCTNPKHAHLPGLYSTEPLDDAAIEFFQALDAECPDVLLMLYWGYRSPWWLLYADTLFDSGVGIEAASFTAFPAPHARDSVTQRLDQAQWHAADVPPLGKDSLGVWLSSWGWNSSIGKERWQEGFVMDMCRGSLLAQPWSDTAWLSPPERKQMARFIALLKARPDCFGNPRFVLGSPWKEEPYGYCCSNGKRAFIGLHNSTWRDARLRLQLNPAWGLPEGQRWQLYRWYPAPARLRGAADSFGPEVVMSLRPFEVVLLEAVAQGQAPTLQEPFEDQPVPRRFAEPSREVPVAVQRIEPPPDTRAEGMWRPLTPTECSSAKGATLTVEADKSVLASGQNVAYDTYTLTATTPLTGITGFRLEALPDPSLPGDGPGRAVNGNFALMRFRVAAQPVNGQGAQTEVALCNPVADFSQEGYGGWPISAALGDTPGKGWSVDPQEGMAHVGIFQCREPIGFAGGTILTFTLQHGEREHNLGRFRLSVTSAPPPFAAPVERSRAKLLVRGSAPACGVPATLVVALRMRRGSEDWWAGDVGTVFAAEGRVDGKAAALTPVIGQAGYPAPWQAWRVELSAAQRARGFELLVTPRVPAAVQLTVEAHLLPGDPLLRDGGMTVSVMRR